MTAAGCVFCAIVAGEAPADVKMDTNRVLVFTPLNPVTEGHVLVVPKMHVADFREDPMVTAEVAAIAAQYAEWSGEEDANLITSAGAAATQTVFHLHLHVVPRRAGDGLLLPWSVAS